VKQETLEVRGYQKLDGVMRRVEARLPARVRAALGYPAAAIKERIAQKIAMILTVPFLRAGIERYVKGSMSFPADDATFEAGGLAVDNASGDVRPQWKLLLRNVGEFSALWLAVLGAWAVSLVTGRAHSSALLLYGVPLADLTFKGNDARFIDFCRRGPLGPLRRATTLIVHTPAKVAATRPGEVTYARFPLLSLLSRRRMGSGDTLFFLAAHARALVAFAAAVMRAPVHCILWRDFAEHAAAAALDRSRAIEAVVITNTNWLQQFLWMNALEDRRFQSFMALYSLNSHAIVYRSDPVSHAHPGLRHLKVDEVWSWNEPYRAVLAAEGVTAPSVAVEPILWYLPEPTTIGVRPTSITVCVFDVTPKTAESSRDSGSLLNYYNTETATRFIDDIVRARDRAAALTGADIRVMLKHKRPAQWMHDRKYFDHIDRLVATTPGFEVAPSDSNVYALIEASVLVIAPPYSSPPYVAAHVGVPSVFYDATGDVMPTHAAHPLVCFVDRIDQLEAVIAEAASAAKAASVPR
jgi:hypothetical protein